MSISIEQPSGHRLAEVRRIRVHGLPGVGGYTLVINLQLSVTAPATDSYLSNLSIRVDWGDNQQRMIGTGVPDQAQPIRLTQYSNEATISFRLLLSPTQIEAIEALRNGGDINLSIWLRGNVFRDSNSYTIQQQGTFPVSQQEWVEALNRMEYCRSFLYELTLPYEENDQKPAFTLVQRAQYHLLRGHYDECVGECRKLLEACPLNDADQKALKTAREKHKGDRAARESMDVPEHMLALRDALTSATHLAHHHNSSDGYSRGQARAIFGATISILSVFSERELA
jgi:hypothetical protein